MRLLILAAALAAPSSALSAPPGPIAGAPQVAPPGAIAGPLASPSANCRRPDVMPADAPATPEAKRLGELPDGDLILSVYRETDGCMDPVIVRYGDGRGLDTQGQAPEPVRPRARIWR